MEFTIRQIADKNGCSTRVVQKLIRQHPELGIVTEERKKTYLTQHQAAQVSALLNQKSSRKGFRISGHEFYICVWSQNQLRIEIRKAQIYPQKLVSYPKRSQKCASLSQL